MIRYRGDCAGVLQVQRSRGDADVEVRKQKTRGICAGLLHVQVHLQMQRCKYGGSEVLKRWGRCGTEVVVKMWCSCGADVVQPDVVQYCSGALVQGHQLFRVAVVPFFQWYQLCLVLQLQCCSGAGASSCLVLQLQWCSGAVVQVQWCRQ